MKYYRLVLVALGVVLLSARVQGGGRLDQLLSMNIEQLMEMEVTISTNTKQTVTRAPAVVTVITAEDIKATGSTNLTEILESVPGIHVRTSYFAYRPLVQFRGASDKQTLLMVNGNPVKDLMWSFGIFWKGLPTSIIDRVEIIRGPGSALYGADAAAGVINVITKTAGKMERSEIGVRKGSFGTETAWMQHGDNWHGFDVAMTLELHNTDGADPFIAVDGQVRQDQSAGTMLSSSPDSARVGWRNMDLRFSVARENWRLMMDYVRHSDIGIGLTGAGILDPMTKGDDRKLNVDLLYKNESFSEDWGLDASLRYQDLEYSSGDGFQERPAGYTDASGFYPEGLINQMRSAERRVTAEVSGLYRGFDDHAVRLGAGYTWQDLYLVEQVVNSGIGADGFPLPAGGPLVDLSDTGFAFAPEKDRKIHYLFLQDVWTITDDWELTAGLRYDHYSDFGDTLNPRVALVWQSTDRLTSKFLYGQAFRAPNYQELFAETSFTLPNADLEPEHSETIELGFSYAATKDLNLGLNIYHLHEHDIIRAITVGGLSKRQYRNTGEHRINGIELEARWQATDDLRFSGNYSYRDSEDNVYRSIDSPNEEAYLRADWRFRQDWHLNVQANWVGERRRSDTDSRPPVDDYIVADATMRYSGLKNWEFAASVRNLLDEDAREYIGSSVPNDLPMPERSFYAEARYNLDELLK